MAEQVPVEQWRERIERALADGFCYCFDLTAVDELGAQEAIRVILRLGDQQLANRLTLEVFLPRQAPKLPDCSDLLPGLAWLQRQARDYFGVEFMGGDERPLLVHEGPPPLCKEYLLAERQRKPWPGGVAAGETAGRRRRQLPPGVPTPEAAAIGDPATLGLSAAGIRRR